MKRYARTPARLAKVAPLPLAGGAVRSSGQTRGAKLRAVRQMPQKPDEMQEMGMLKTCDVGTGHASAVVTVQRGAPVRIIA